MSRKSFSFRHRASICLPTSTRWGADGLPITCAMRSDSKSSTRSRAIRMPFSRRKTIGKGSVSRYGCPTDRSCRGCRGSCDGYGTGSCGKHWLAMAARDAGITGALPRAHWLRHRTMEAPPRLCDRGAAAHPTGSPRRGFAVRGNHDGPRQPRIAARYTLQRRRFYGALFQRGALRQ